jgi:hypothetical protein
MPGRTRVDWTIFALCAAFIYILTQSAIWEPEVRVLHFFQALIYVATLVLALRRSKWAYGAGASISLFWLLLTTLGTTFLRSGIEEWAHFFATGEVARPTVFLAVPAGVDQAALIVCCAWAYAKRRDRKASDLAILVASAVASVGYFVAIMAAFRPEFLAGVRHIVVR